MRVSAGLNPAAIYSLDSLDDDLAVFTGIIPAAVDAASSVRGQRELSVAARFHSARHSVAVFNAMFCDLSAVRRVSLTRILSTALDLAADSVRDDALQKELAVRTSLVSGAVHLAHVGTVDVGALTRIISVTQNADSRSIALQFDIFDAKTGGIPVANECHAAMSAQDGTAWAAIVIVLTRHFRAEDSIGHPPVRAFSGDGDARTVLAMRSIGNTGLPVWEIGVDDVLGDR